MSEDAFYRRFTEAALAAGWRRVIRRDNHIWYPPNGSRPIPWHGHHHKAPLPPRAIHNFKARARREGLEI